MKPRRTLPLLLALVSSVGLVAPLGAQEERPAAVTAGATPGATAAPTASQFEPPVQLTSENRPLGAGRLFPSPVVHDLDGDGVPEIYLGDLPGNITVTRRAAVDGSVAWEATKPLNGASGQQLKFQNW